MFQLPRESSATTTVSGSTRVHLLPIGAAKPAAAAHWDLIQSCNVPPPKSCAPDVGSSPPPPPPPYPPSLMVPPVPTAILLSPRGAAAATTIASSHARNLSRAHIIPPPPPPPASAVNALRTPPPASPRLSSLSTLSLSCPSPTTPRSIRMATPIDVSAPALTPRAALPRSPRTPNGFQPGRAQPPPLPGAMTETRRPASHSVPSLKITPPPLPASVLAAAAAQLTSSPPAVLPGPPPPLPRSLSAADAHLPSSQSPVTPRSSKSIATRAKIEAEILSTEATYLSNLQHFVTEFIAPLRARIRSGKKEDAVGSLDEDGLNRIAGNIETITNFHSSFYQELQDEFRASQNTQTSPNLARIFVQFSNFFKVYTTFISSYEACVMQMEELRENERFQAYVRGFMQKARRPSHMMPTPPAATLPTSPPAPTTNLSPMDYIIQPVQRLPRYVLLLKELLRHTPTADAAPIDKALTSMEAIASFVNERKRSVENMNRLLDIALRISGELPPEVHLIEPHRKLIREGQLSIISSRSILGVGLGSCKATGCIVRLFTDLVLWTTSSNKYKGYLDLNTCGIIPSDQDELCFQLSDAKTTIYCRGTSPEEVHSWSAQIQLTIATLQHEKESTRRRQRVAKARSTTHTHRTQLRTLIKDNLFNLPGTSTSGADESLEEDQAAQALAADPQMQAEWLEKEAAAQRQRDKAACGSASSVPSSPPMHATLLPKELIAQLKAQQLLSSASTCTTATNSAAPSRLTSRRPSSNSALASTNSNSASTSDDAYSHDRHSSQSRSMDRPEISLGEEELNGGDE